MEINEQNIAVAECLGWKNIRESNDGSLENTVYGESDDGVSHWSKFVTDANTRKEMLAVLTDLQFSWLIDEFMKHCFGDDGKPEITDHADAKVALMKAFDLDQPTFTKLFLQTVGKWRE